MNSCTQLSQKEMSACVCGGAKRGEPDQIGTIMGDATFNCNRDRMGQRPSLVAKISNYRSQSVKQSGCV